MLSQMFYWSNITKDPEYWFYKTQKDWEEETGLTRHEQDSARKILKEKNLIFEKRAGIPATIHFKINFQACFDSLLLSGNLDDGELAKLYAEKQQSSKPKNGNLYTETTTETTTDISSNDDSPIIAFDTEPRKEVHTEPSKKAKTKKKGGAEKNLVFTSCVDYWLKEFHPGWTFGGVQGKALNSLINKIRASSADPADAILIATFKRLCQSLPEWYKGKDLPVIDSKFNEIIEEIQKPKQIGWNQMNSAERLFGGY